MKEKNKANTTQYVVVVVVIIIIVITCDDDDACALVRLRGFVSSFLSVSVLGGVYVLKRLL